MAKASKNRKLKFNGRINRDQNHKPLFNHPKKTISSNIHTKINSYVPPLKYPANLQPSYVSSYTSGNTQYPIQQHQQLYSSMYQQPPPPPPQTPYPFTSSSTWGISQPTNPQSQSLNNQNNILGTNLVHSQEIVQSTQNVPWPGAYSNFVIISN